MSATVGRQYKIINNGEIFPVRNILGLSIAVTLRQSNAMWTHAVQLIAALVANGKVIHTILF